MRQPAKGSWFRKPVKQSRWDSYRLNVLLCELMSAGILAILGKPFWPPYLLLVTLVLGLIVGVLTTARQRRLLGLPVIPLKSRSANTDHMALEVHPAEEGNSKDPPRF